MNIFIVGPMGSGKSTVGKIISSELFLNFFDTDEEIEEMEKQIDAENKAGENDPPDGDDPRWD